jgi:copper oxidase (laccase) domain-containing protein
MPVQIPLLPPIETFPALNALSGLVRHGFVGRVPAVPVAMPKQEVLAALQPWHEAAVRSLGFTLDNYFTAEQVHGADVATAPQVGLQHIPNVDGLMTNQPGILLGIHVADCGAIYIVDPGHGAIALLHSGKNGSALGIVKRAILAMGESFGSRPQDLIVQLGPCIRPPAYEVNFPSQIHIDALSAGVPPSQYFDCGACTYLAADSYYSYRRELGHTGRLLALLGMP